MDLVSISIREATLADLSAIVDIYNSTISDRMATADTEPIAVANRLDWLQNRSENRPVWVAQNKENVIGWLSLNNFYGRPAYGGTAEVSLYVASAFRRQGVGSLLLSNAIATAPQLGIKILLGFIFAHNQPSLQLFIRYGFSHWGLLPQVAELDGKAKDLAILGRKITD